MPKNKKGGSGHKKQANKHVMSNPNRNTRFAKESGEIYACCNKVLGNGMCLVLCQDGKERICIIRKKFRGRGKRDNTLSSGTWMMVGKREFETANDTKKEKCDLLEVYNREDCKKLEQNVKGVNWNAFRNLSTKDKQCNDDSITFDESAPEIMAQNRRFDFPSDDDDENEYENEIVSNNDIHDNGDNEEIVDINDI